MNLARNSGSKNLVLFFQELNILGQFLVGPRCDHGQQGVENLAHRGIVTTSDYGTDFTLVVPRFHPEKTHQWLRFSEPLETRFSMPS